MVDTARDRTTKMYGSKDSPGQIEILGAIEDEDEDWDKKQSSRRSTPLDRTPKATINERKPVSSTQSTLRENEKSPSIPSSGLWRKRRPSTDRPVDLSAPFAVTGTTKPPTWSRRSGSVWSEYSRGHEVNFGGGFFHMAGGRSPGEGLAFLQKHGSSGLSERLAILTRPHSPHLVTYRGCFESPSETYLVFEPMNMSLLQVSNALRLPTEQEVVAIAGQLVEAVRNLASHDIVHGRLKLYNVLISLDGQVKIFLDESCHRRSGDAVAQQRNVQDLGEILKELTTTVEVEEVLPSSARPAGYSPELLGFISEASRGDLETLAQDSFLKQPWAPADLEGLFFLAYMSSRFVLRDSSKVSASKDRR
ncbi:hypothetical protein H2198_005055 [Neophaeococcomyces mojaviensis]|uniref:Uncharacterized protein n=1 Tax=Neophaeococcomyces mojaviensis TaxID=3383035 RepID=A0ACC3A6S4_9EURO|nr:hypothetical protein H2198_005055 [Knufia sp. JES_112]